jgi:hypothetical protein
MKGVEVKVEVMLSYLEVSSPQNSRPDSESRAAICAPVDEDDSDVSNVQDHDLWCGGPGHDDTEISKEFGM